MLAIVDRKALKILMNAYWGPQGWKDPDLTDPEDIDYAVRAGLMFRPWYAGHDEVIRAARQAVSDVRLIDVSNAFVASLSTRRLDLRSALGSYACGLNLPDHAYTGASGCETCALYGDRPERRDLNVLSFERLKWGGVRHLDPLYIAFDLGQFSLLSKVAPTDEDLRIMNTIIETVVALAPGSRASQLERSLAGVFISNADERRVLIQILGYCGVLETKSVPGPATRFTPSVGRPFPPTPRDDWSYPVSWWTRADGLNWSALSRFFPQDGVLGER